eukprot:8000586-Pyramimonas_sp.AAC.1
MGGGTACGRSHWNLRWSSLWGHEACYGATKRVRGVLEWVVEPHADAATGAFCGAPYGATKRVKGVPEWGVEPHADAATGAF